LNEVLLTSVDSAFNRYLREHNALPERPLLAETPMDLRKSDTDPNASNVVAILYVNLGEPDADPITRLRQVHKSSKATKEEAQNVSSEALMSFSMLPQVAATVADKLGIAQELPPIANILVSNVKGLSKPCYLKGARLQNTFTAPPIGPGMAMTIITCSYMDTIDVGMSSDRDAIPELEKLADYIGEAFEELEAAVLAKRAAADEPSESTKAVGSKPGQPAKAAAGNTKAELAPEAEAAK
jgi:hypothetical protein